MLQLVTEMLTLGLTVKQQNQDNRNGKKIKCTDTSGDKL